MFYHDKTTVSEAHATTFSYFLCPNDRPKSSKLLQKGFWGAPAFFALAPKKQKIESAKPSSLSQKHKVE
jgi:hypothetical protein